MEKITNMRNKFPGKVVSQALSPDRAEVPGAGGGWIYLGSKRKQPDSPRTEASSSAWR